MLSTILSSVAPTNSPASNYVECKYSFDGSSATWAAPRTISFHMIILRAMALVHGRADIINLFTATLFTAAQWYVVFGWADSPAAYLPRANPFWVIHSLATCKWRGFHRSRILLLHISSTNYTNHCQNSQSPWIPNVPANQIVAVNQAPYLLLSSFL